MLQEILKNLKISEDSRTLIFVDDGFAEFIKWNQECCFLTMKVLELELNSMTKKILQLYQPAAVVCFISMISESITHMITEIQFLSSCGNILLLTTFSREILETFDYFHPIISSSQYRIVYLPLHTLNVLQPTGHNVGLFTLTSPSCRHVFPLLLHRLGNFTGTTVSLNNKRISKIHQVAAEDIPLHSRQSLKLVAHELAGSLIFDLGLDPTGSIFAVGKTSSLIGHTLQPLLATLSQQRASNSLEGYTLLRSEKTTPTNLENCTLIIVDRTIDLFTPTSHDPSPPLAHRAYCTLPKSKISTVNTLDIALHQPLATLLSSEQTNSDTQYSPLSAVSALPIHITPSVSPPYLEPDQSLNNEFINAMFAVSEENGKTILYDALRKKITESNGTLPPAKKRGIGAELLGLVNALLSTSSKENSATNMEALCLESAGLISWSLALIDSLQRSSTKQLQAHLSSLPNSDYLLQCLSSYEMKSTRERVLLSSIIQQSQLSLLSYTVLTEIILEACGLSGNTSNGVVDIEHMFQMILGTLSLIESIMELEHTSDSQLQEVIAMIGKAVTTYLIQSCHLTEAKRHRLLPEEILQDVSTYRDLVQQSDPEAESLFQRLFLEVEDIINNFLDILREIAFIKSSSLDLPSTTRVPSIYDNLLTFDLENEMMSSDEPSRHRVVKRLTSDDNSKPGSPNKSSQTSSTLLPIGIIPKIISSLLKERNNFLSGRKLSNIPQLIHIENPIFSIARAGFGMLGRLGLAAAGNVTQQSHPCSNSTIVIFVLGGISLIELKQIQEIYRSDSGYQQTQLLIGSNSICSPDDIYEQVFYSLER